MCTCYSRFNTFNIIQSINENILNPTPPSKRLSLAGATWCDQDGLGDFRQRLEMELNLREISAEAQQSWQVAYSEEPGLPWRVVEGEAMISPKFEMGR